MGLLCQSVGEIDGDLANLILADPVLRDQPGRAEAAMRTHLSEILTSLPELAERVPDLLEAGSPEFAEAGTAA